MSLKITVDVHGSKYEVETHLSTVLQPEQLPSHMQLASSVIANQMQAKRGIRDLPSRHRGRPGYPFVYKSNGTWTVSLVTFPQNELPWRVSGLSYEEALQLALRRAHALGLRVTPKKQNVVCINDAREHQHYTPARGM